MANLDSRSKRASSIALFGLLVAPVFPDGTIGQGDRQHIAFSYSGITAEGGEVVTISALKIPSIPTVASIPSVA